MFQFNIIMILCSNDFVFIGFPWFSISLLVGDITSPWSCNEGNRLCVQEDLRREQERV